MDVRKSPRHKRLTLEQVEPRRLLAVVIEAGDLGHGVAVSDEATGDGYLLYSEKTVHERFENIDPENADHFIAVRFQDQQWQYNDDTAWQGFSSEAVSYTHLTLPTTPYV